MNEDNMFDRTLFHKDYNIDHKDNINTFPTEPAVFGIFGIIRDKPVRCRYVGETENLREALRNLYEKAEAVSVGFKNFMQGHWVQKLVYELMPNSTPGERQKEVEEWKKKFNPKCDETGAYPKV